MSYILVWVGGWVTVGCLGWAAPHRKNLYKYNCIYIIIYLGDGVHLVEEEDAGGGGAGLVEEVADIGLGLAEPLFIFLVWGVWDWVRGVGVRG